MVDIRVKYSFSQFVARYDANLRIKFVTVQRVEYQSVNPNLRVKFVTAQRIEYQDALPVMRGSVFLCQYIQRAPEYNVSSEVYPALPGLTYSTGATPMFSTNVSRHTSGKETRTSYWEDPRWRFDLEYDYLPNKTPSASTDYKRLVGFFCSRNGSFDTFLFKAPDDYYCERLEIGTGDGDQVEFPLFRPLGSFEEPIGQVDTDAITVYVQSASEDHTIPASPGPYTVTLDHTDVDSLIWVKNGATTMTQVSGAPGEDQYNWDPGTATLTFSSINQNDTVSVRYRWVAELITDYEILLPRTIVMQTAPATGDIVTATFEFFFVCRFEEDMAEFSQFMDKLWELGKVSLMSVLV